MIRLLTGLVLFPFVLVAALILLPLALLFLLFVTLAILIC